MLVDDNVLEESEPGREPDAILVRVRSRFTADDHRRTHTCRPRTRSGEYDLRVAHHVAQLVGKLCAAQDRDQTHLIAAGYEDAFYTVEQFLRVCLNYVMPGSRAQHARVRHTEIPE